jgi:hypothetical protein
VNLFELLRTYFNAALNSNLDEFVRQHREVKRGYESVFVLRSLSSLLNSSTYVENCNETIPLTFGHSSVPEIVLHR